MNETKSGAPSSSAWIATIFLPLLVIPLSVAFGTSVGIVVTGAAVGALAVTDYRRCTTEPRRWERAARVVVAPVAVVGVLVCASLLASSALEALGLPGFSLASSRWLLSPLVAVLLAYLLISAALIPAARRRRQEESAR